MATVDERLDVLEKNVTQLQEDVVEIRDTTAQIVELVKRVSDMANQFIGLQRQLIGRFDKLEMRFEESGDKSGSLEEGMQDGFAGIANNQVHISNRLAALEKRMGVETEEGTLWQPSN